MILNTIPLLIAALLYTSPGVTLTVPAGWALIGDSVHPTHERVIGFAPKNQFNSLDTLLVQVEAAKHRTLAQFVHDFKAAVMAPLPIKISPALPKTTFVQSKAHMICHGTQSAWFVASTDGNGLYGETVLAIDATHGVAALYMHEHKAAPAVLAALDSVCLK